jgi:geranylgeranyl diphosphate synthase, type I
MSHDSKAKKSQLILNQKSEKAQIIFQKIAKENNTGIEKIDKAVEQYLSKFNDTARQGVLAIANEAVGGTLDDIVPLQVALSFIDVTMDIHDDIIDESITKENGKTIYGKIGREICLLVGDYFMTKSFYYLQQSIANISKDRQILIMNAANNFLSEVVSAHICEVQLRKSKWKITPEDYFQVLIKKAADFEGRMKIGAIFGGGSQEEINAFSIYGRNLGILLIVRSEYVDLFEPSELSSKIKNGCLPLPLLYALQKKSHARRIKSLLSKETFDASDSRKLLKIIQETEAFPDLREKLIDLENEALQALKQIKSDLEKHSLELIVTSMLEDL